MELLSFEIGTDILSFITEKEFMLEMGLQIKSERC